MTEWSLFISKEELFNITVIQVYAPSSNAEEAEVEWFYEDPKDLLELIPPKDVLFIIGDWIAKVGSQETSGVTGKFGLGVQNEAGRRLIEFCQGNTLVIATPSSSNTREDSTHGHHHNQIDYIPCSQRWRSSIQSAKTRPEADCGSDHELLIAKFRLKLKKVGKTNRPLRYDLNQIPYDYTVEVRNRFKGLDLTECLMNYEWRFMMIQWMLVIWSLVHLPFLNPAWTSGSSRFKYWGSLACRILSITLLACEMSAIVQ